LAVVTVAITVTGALAAPTHAQTPASPAGATPPALVTDSPPAAQELARARDLVRANALELAQEVLESRAPALRPGAAWLAWERQLWVVYRLRGRWAALYARTAPGARWPGPVGREARLQAVKALTELGRGREARALIQAALADAESSPAQQRQARRALIAAHLADGDAAEAGRALREFQARYGLGAVDAELQLATAASALRAGDADAAINQLATVDSAPARLLKLYARLRASEMAAGEVAAGALALLESPAAPVRSIYAVVAAAHREAGARYPLTDALEAYLLAPPVESSPVGAYPEFTVADLRAAYADIAAHQIRRAGLATQDAAAWLDYAQRLPPALGVARRALFAHLAATTERAEIRRAAVDGYVEEIATTARIGLILLFFGADKPLGELALGGRAGLRLAAAAVAAGDFAVAAAAGAALREFPADGDRAAWLLRAGRVDVFAGHHARGAGRLAEYLESFEALTDAQTDAVLQPIFDLQTVGEHALALPLLRQVDARAPRGKHQREIAFWRAQSHAGAGRQRRAAELFLHSAMQADDSFDRWGRAARLRAAEALVEAGLFGDARRLLQDLLVGATSDARRLRLRAELQRVRLLQGAAESPSPTPTPTPSPSPAAEAPSPTPSPAAEAPSPAE